MTIYPNVGALTLAAAVKTMLAASELKLYKEIASSLGPATVLADFTEADFSGYASAVIADWLLPYIDPAGGASIQSGTQQFNFITPVGAPVLNTILGFWLETAGGDLIIAANFDAPIAMTQAGDSIPVNVTLNYGRS